MLNKYFVHDFLSVLREDVIMPQPYVIGLSTYKVLMLAKIFKDKEQQRQITRQDKCIYQYNLNENVTHLTDC